MKLNKEKIMEDIDAKMEVVEHCLALLCDSNAFDISDLDIDMHPDGECVININGFASDDDEDEDDSEDICDGDCDSCEYFEEDDEDHEPPCLGIPAIDSIVFNPPATIVFWADGTKTETKCMDGQPFERYAGFSAAVMKKLFGSTSRAKRVMERCEQKKPEPEKKPEPKPEPEPKKALTKPDEKFDPDKFNKDLTQALATSMACLILAILGGPTKNTHIDEVSPEEKE